MRRSGLLVAALAMVIAGTLWQSNSSRRAPVTSPSGDSRFDLAGIEEPVRIVTDRHGIPHLRAESTADLYFAWGFVTARDRLWQMEVSRRGARGELWEWFGNRTLQDDGGAQLFELSSRASRIWERERRDQAVRVPLEAYAAGVNAYLEACRRGSRPWPEELLRLGRRPGDWRPEDSVLLLIAQGLVLDLNLPEIEEATWVREHGIDWVRERDRFENDFVHFTIPDSAARRLYGGKPRAGSGGDRGRGERTMRESSPGDGGVATNDGADALAGLLSALRGEDRDRASNVFAVAGRRSTSGKPLLANDPHLTLRAPGAFHALHVSAPGVDAIGAAVPGLPIIVSGRSRACAWGITALSADVIDVYADTLSADGRAVRWNGVWVPLRHEGFTMRYRLLGALPLPLFGRSRQYSPHGPVLILDRKNRVALSARWAGSDSAVTLARLLGVETASRAEDIAARFRTLVTPGLNMVAADTLGNVVYQAAGAIPRRGFPNEPGVMPGDGRHEWQGLVPADEMPAWRAPPDGFIVNANNLPVGASYPEPLPRFDWAHDRAARIASRLEGDRAVTLADMRSIQNDVYSRGAERFVPRLLRCVDSTQAPLSSMARAALDTLRGWDFVARRDRVAPTIYRAWFGALQRRSRLDNQAGLAAAALDGRAPEAFRIPGGETPEPVGTAVVQALDLALAELSRQFGHDMRAWRWGEAHLARFAHGLAWKDSTLSPPPVPADGDNSTPCVGRSNLPWSPTFTHGAAFRHLVDLAVADSSLGLVPPGNSGDRASGHARDHLRRWANHGYVPFYLSWERIAAELESEMTLRPVR